MSQQAKLAELDRRLRRLESALGQRQVRAQRAKSTQHRRAPVFYDGSEQKSGDEQSEEEESGNEQSEEEETCDDQSDEADCAAIPGCGWSKENERCVRESSGCGSLSDEADCAADSECGWSRSNERCVRDPGCGSLSESECGMQQHCGWGGVEGEEESCFFDPDA